MASGPVLPAEDEQVSWGIDDLHISLQAEQEDTQKRTFTCWINSQLAKHTPPSAISDLFTDIQRGHVLLDLLEVLSGEQLPRDKGSNTFQCRLNIEHALKFLKSRSIKLINIHVADIIEGNPSIILGLIWIIILHFHIAELAQTLSCNPSQPSLDGVSVAEPSPTSGSPAKKCSKAQKRWQLSAKKALLLWAQEQCATSKSVSVTDFKTSWRNGMAFLAVIHALRPDLIDMTRVRQRSNKDNLREAFRIAERELNIPPLLEPEDVDVVNPDEKSIMTYVAQFLQYSKDAPGAAEKAQGTMKDVMVWVTQQEEKLQKMLADSEKEAYCKKYESLLSFLESFGEGKKPVLDILSMKGNLDELNEDQLRLRKAWDGLNYQINVWKTKLNDDLPSPLCHIEAWLRQVEGLTEADLPTSHDYYEAIALMEEKMALFKSLMDKCDGHSNTLLAFENRDENQLPLVPAYKLEEMKRRINNISGKKFIPLLEFHYYKCSVLGLLDEVKSKLKAWNIKYGSRDSVESLLEDWHKFIEERGFLAQLESSFQKCEEIHKSLGGEYQNVSEQYTMMEHNISMCRKSIDHVKSTLQKVLACWTTYTEKLRFLKACFEETKKEQITEVPSETLSQWNLEHTTLNEVGNFLIQVSSDEVGPSISKELRRLNKRWRKFVTKTQLEMKMPLIKKQAQPVLGNSENMLPSKEEKPTVDSSTDTPLERPENHNQNIKAGEEHEKENEEFTGQLKVAEEVEKLIGEVEIWEAEAKSVSDLLRHKDDVDSSMEESLQHLIAKGSMYEALVSRMEDTLQMDVQSISSQESLENVLTAGLQAKIQEAKEKVQINMVKLGALWKDSADVSPGLSARTKVEGSLKELESYITRAEQLLGQRESRSGLISKYKEALLIFNTKSLAKYLKAVEELKSNVTEDVKLSLEEKSSDVCAKWESLHHELSLYIQQLKIDIEKGKISDTISRLEKQVNKEKKMIRRGRTKGLLKEHEACFSEEGSLHQLGHHMAALRELCEELTSQRTQQDVRRALQEYEQRIERLRKSASEIHATLRPPGGGASKSKGTQNTSENGGRDDHSEAPSANPDTRPSAEKAVGSIKNLSLASELKPEQEEKEHNASINNLRDRYDTHTGTLELHLQNNKARITSDFPSDREWSSTCLQDKLEDLQVLKNETDACWKEFETTSLQLEELESDVKKPFIIKTRDKLKKNEREFQMTLTTRMESLETALQLVVPVEKASLLLCGSDLLLLHEVAIADFRFTDAEGIYQNLEDIQDSIAKQIDICNNLEQLGNFASKELHPLDLRATQTIILRHRSQLAERSHRIQRSRDALRALEDFLASLKAAALPGGLVTDPSASGTQAAPGDTSTVKNKEGDIYLMKEKARHLDKRLKMLDISFKDAERGEDTSCEKLLGALAIPLLETCGSGGQGELPEGDTLLDTCIFKNNELLRSILEVQSQVSKIGLKDPTVPAVKQRKKSLLRLDKVLDDYEKEKKRLQEMASSLPPFKDGREKALGQQCRNTAFLWESTKGSVAECLDQCERVLELLKQYQNFKSILTTLIQKEENVISLQASYMGKDNLKKRIAEIEIVKEEFNEHSEVVDKINQVCKNLQFHLNKMRTFEEPPFEKEANVIVDRWLDINEKTEDYYENLGQALALWDKLFSLKDVIDEWTEKALRKMELHQLTEVERDMLKAELQVHEQKPSEFSKRVAKIQFLLRSSEIPLELQVMESSILNKIEHVKMLLSGDSSCSALSGNTAELREDLDQAKTQIGMTESLLKALSPSDSLEIFTKLEEIQQQILQQKQSMVSLENQIGCLTPELSELKKQYESVSDLFNTKKSVLQDHFSKLLNDQCKNFNDWFSNIKMNLEECFESSDTKKSMEQKLQKLSDFLTLEGRGSQVQQVETVVNRVRKHLPKARVKELNSWIVLQEIDLEKMESVCQVRAKELEGCLQQLLRLQEDHRDLSNWLAAQEEKWKEVEQSGEKTELFCQALARKREQFEAVAQLNNSLKECGLTEEEEIILESAHLIDRYQALLRQIEEEDKLPPAEAQGFNDLAQDVIHWITGIKESLMVLNSSEGQMPLEETIQKIKEIILLKPEGDAKIQRIRSQAAHSKAPLDQEAVTDIDSQWVSTLQLANTYLSHQEKLLLEGEKYLESKEDLRLMLTELKKKQEVGFALQHGLQEKKAQLKNYKKFLQKAQDLTSLLKELKSQGNYLLECTKNPNFSEESWLEIKHLHESLLQQLQDSVQKLEGHVQEHHTYQVCITDLNTELDNISKECASVSDKPVDPIEAEEKLQELQELENRLHLHDGTLEKILGLAGSIEQNTSSAGQKLIKEDITSLKCKQKDLERKLESAKQEMENYLNSILKSKCSAGKKEEFPPPGREKQVTPDALESTRGSAAVEKLEGDLETNKNSAVEMLLSKQLSLSVQESMKNTEDEQKVNELQNQPLELDIVLRNEQLKEIEELYAQLEAKKAAIEPPEQTEYLSTPETRALALPSPRSSAQRLDSLLQALTALKKNKERQCCLLKDFQEHLAAIESSLKVLLAEKESLKVGSQDSATYVAKIQRLLASIEKEKDALSGLKIEWETISNSLSDMDRKLLESQVRQLEQGWKQAEQLVLRKHSQHAMEQEELAFLMREVRELGLSLQQQHQRLRLRLSSPEAQERGAGTVALATDLQAAKHRFSVLKARAELQMKRIWGEKEKKVLEDALDGLQKQLEASEPLHAEADSEIKKSELRTKVKETTVWVKNQLGELEATISLLPDGILSQIRKCKVRHDGILGQQRALEALAEAARESSPGLPAPEREELQRLLQDLQGQCQALVLKSTQRSQLLELKLEERSTFVAEIGRVQLSLQGHEARIAPQVGAASAAEAELQRQRAALTASREELRGVAAGLSAHLQQLTGLCQDLSVFERLFLDDRLKSLDARASRTQRFIEHKCHDVEHKIQFSREFHEQLSALQKELDSIRHTELLLGQEGDGGAEGGLRGLRGRLRGVRSSLRQALRLKEAFGSLGLRWDGSQLDTLRSQVFETERELEGKIKQLDTFMAECGKYQASLSKLRAMDLQIKKRAEAVLTAPPASPESRLLGARVLSQRIERAMSLHREIVRRLSESKAFDDSFKEEELRRTKPYAEESDTLCKVLQSVVLESRPREMDEESFQERLENSLHVFNQVKAQLQQPLLVHLQMEHIQKEMDNCEAFQERVQAEMCGIEGVTVTGKGREETSSEACDLETKLRDVEELHGQLIASIDVRTNVLNDAHENLTRYNEAVSRAMGVIAALEAFVTSHRVDLDRPEESLEMPRGKQEELESTITDLQSLSEKLGAVASPDAQVQLQCTLQELVSKNSALREAVKVKEAEIERSLENYQCYGNLKEKIGADLSRMEAALAQSMAPLPVSYKEALGRLEQSKALVSNLLSLKAEFMKLRQVLRRLRPTLTDSDGTGLLRIVLALWEKWLRLLEVAKEWEMWCEELKQEWKFVNEEVEREAIILDNLQEELPEISKAKEAASTAELSELLECLRQYEETAEKQQLLLLLLLQRCRSAQRAPAARSSGAAEPAPAPAAREITAMQERCNKLFQKAQKNKELVQNEIQERHSFTRELITLKNLFQRTTSSLQNMGLQDHPERAEQFEELQSTFEKGKRTLENIMEKLRIKYSEMYTIVPAEIDAQVGDCRKALEALEEEISKEVLKTSPSYAMSRKIDEINEGLHKVEKMLQQKSKSIEKAQEIQKEMWDELDLWHAELNALDSEVHDAVERDPGRAQEWMDRLVGPFQQYQQVAQRAEARTSQLNKATVKMEEYHDLLKSTEAWIENNRRLLANPADYDSSKTLSHHASALQMALEDSEQKHNLLHSIFTDLEGLSVIFETDDLAQSIQELSRQVAALQQSIMESLPQIQRMAYDVVAIETELKSMEKRVSKIKAILLSKEIFDFSPEEHLKHGEVVLENIHPMKKTIAEIMSYQVELRLPQTGMKPLPVFQRTNQLLQDIKLLENVTREQNELLKIAIKQTNECDEEIDRLKEVLNDYSAELSPEEMSPGLQHTQGEGEGIEKQIVGLSQKKEDLLVALKAAVLNLHGRLQQERQALERDEELLSAGASEDDGAAQREVSEWKLNRRASLPFLPAVKEEAEESSLKSESGDRAKPSSGSRSFLWKHDKEREEDAAPSSSGTVIQEAAGKVSTCGSSAAPALAAGPLSPEQGPAFCPHPDQTEGGAAPPAKAAALGSPAEQGASHSPAENLRPEPEEVLHACKTQVAELELWLHQASVAFEPETLNADMQQAVEQQLVGCQTMLTEIEHKVASLLELCRDQGLADSGAVQQEAEALALKLKTVKSNLEKVQLMLQEKYSEDPHSTILKKPSEHGKVLQPDSLSELESVVMERTPFARQKDFQQQEVLELKPVEQKDLVKFTELNAQKTWPEDCQRDEDTSQKSPVSGEASSPGTDAPGSVLTPQDRSGAKWRYLRQELSSKIQPPLPPLVEPQVSTDISILPSVSVYNFRYPTAEELKAYTTQLEDLRQEANNLQTQGNATEETYSRLDKQLFELFLALSQCLGSVEELLQTPGLCREDTGTQQVFYETLALELKKLSLALSDKKKDLLKAMAWPGRTANLFPECFEKLQVYLEHTQAAAASRSKSLKAGLDYNRSYQNEIKRLYDQLTKNKTSLQQSLNESSGQSADEQLQKADAYTAELRNSESRVAKLRAEGERLPLPYALLQEVYKLEDVLDSVWGMLRARYSELGSPRVTESQQDALLRGLEELVAIGKEKLARDDLQQTRSKGALQAQIQNHKLFFQKLVADMLLIQTYSNKMLPSLLQKKEACWAEQVTEVKLLEEKARQRGIKQQSLLQKWEEFDENYASLEKDLEILASSLPSVSLVEETEDRLVERIALYQQIKRNVDEKHARLYQTLNDGKQLAASVSCPELEGQMAKLEEQWLSLNKKIDQELHRLQTLLKHLLSYNRDTDQLAKWLESSQQTLNYWKEQSLNVSQDLDTIRSNIARFFAFSKELDEKSSLKTAVVSAGSQLLHLKEADAAALRAGLARVEQRWAALLAQLPGVQEKLHQLQMERLPSREAIAEMISWMNDVEQQTAAAGRDAAPSLGSASHARSLLQKYKEFRMEMDYKQWIVDFVNQSLLQLSTCDVESKRYERTAFAEHLGEMNRQWQRVHGTLNRKIQHLEQLLESISENENKIQNLSNWMEVQEERLKTLQKPESVVSVQKTLLDCQDIENQLAVKCRALDELRHSCLTSESGTAPLLEDTAASIDRLFQKSSSVINQVNELKTAMQPILQEWKAYGKLSEDVAAMTVRFGYCVEHSKPMVLSLEALRCQVQNLQSLQDEAESSEGHWQKLQEVIGKLKGYCPSVAEIIEEKRQRTHTRWAQVNRDITEQLQAARGLLQLWEACASAHSEAAARLDQQEAKYHQLANIGVSGNNLAETLPPALRDVEELQREVQKTREALVHNSALLGRLLKPAESGAHALLSGHRHALQRASFLEQMLLAKADELEFVLSQFKDFGDRLESLKGRITQEEENLDKLYQEEKEENPDSFLTHVLALAAHSPAAEQLNEVSLRLPLSDVAVKTLKSMNRQWIRATATALERCSELQGIRLHEQFLSCCEKWVHLLERMEETLRMSIADSLPALLEQQKAYEMLEAEVSINQTIADCYVTQSLQLLDTTEIEERPAFAAQFSALRARWQGAARGVRRRRRAVAALVRRWRRFSAPAGDLLRFLAATGQLLSAVRSQDGRSLFQTRSLIHELKNKEIHFERWQTTYELTLEAGEKLLSTTDLESKESVSKRIGQLQDSWKDTKTQVGEMIKHFQSIVEAWDQCEKKTKELESQLRVLKAQSQDPLPEPHGDLQREKERIKELEKSLAHWAQNLKELQTMKTDLTQHMLVEDAMALQEQMELLHRQWEDLCLRVAVRKQEIEDRLNSWVVFNEKNKELCAWLVQMENRVLQTADVSIEEMIEKLEKDCMEEINLFSENKLQLKHMGGQLIQASSQARAAEVDDKLSKINDRWQHLLDVIGSRVKKLKETFAFIQQLDKNMSSLRSWLARIESELSKPVVYAVCDDQEIQKRLAEQQDLQRDIEQHSAGVESVFSICDVLLHDSDACASETECDSVQQTTRSLDRRWRNICAMSMERRMKIEETWRLWQKFLDDYSRFEDWLASAERTAASPNSSEVLYTVTKEELKRFEAFQRQVHERLTQLELVNKQYRRLARENRTDTASRLKQMVHEGNQRWDALQRRVTAVLRRLRHFTNQREEFEGTRESILVWLTEMDLQLTNVEHFSESDADDKMRQLNGFQQEITLNTNKIDQLIVFGEQLIQKSEPRDAVLIEDELEELHRYCQEVFGRVARFHRRLTAPAPGLEDEKEASENETDMEDPREIQTDSWRKRGMEEPSSPQALCHLVPPGPGPERSGCETPVSVDSIPLEWDHTGDVGGSSSHEDDEEAPYYSALSGKSISEGHSWHVPDSPSSPKHRYKQMGGDRNVQPIPSDSSTPYKPAYAKLLLSPGADGGKDGPSVLNGSPQREDEGPAPLTGQQPGAFDRWELIQAQELRKKLLMKQDLQQLNADVNDTIAGLTSTEAELETLKTATPPSDVPELGLRAKRLKEILNALDSYKALVASLNVSSKEFLPTGSGEAKELRERVGQLQMHWDAAWAAVESWRAGLRQALMQCQDFHQMSQNLLLWLASAENRRRQAHVTDPKADPRALLGCREELLQLEKELKERQPQVNSLQELSDSLLIKGHGEDYIEAAEKVHVVEKKLRRLLEQVSHDLMSLQGSQIPDPSLPRLDEVDAGDEPPAVYVPAPQAKESRAQRTTKGKNRTDSRAPGPADPGRSRPQRSFLSRVLRAALPLQLLLLLLLLLACLLPSSEEDYSCTQANNFARSFYPMLRYTNGPPPT